MLVISEEHVVTVKVSDDEVVGPVVTVMVRELVVP